jgi:hypothetical protein
MLSLQYPSGFLFAVADLKTASGRKSKRLKLKLL